MKGLRTMLNARHVKDREAARTARVEAEEQLRSARTRRREVETLVADLQDLRARNHFAERIEQSMALRKAR